MADQFDQRWQKKRKKSLLGGLFKKTVDQDLLDEEEQIVADAETVQPIKADKEPGRNDPCPCGSGQKFKKCCFGLSAREIAKKSKKNK